MGLGRQTWESNCLIKISALLNIYWDHQTFPTLLMMPQHPPSTTTQGLCYLGTVHGMIVLLGHLNRGLTLEPKKANYRSDPNI